ncbi:MAG: ATP-binding protein [Bacteroidales bacterium]|nr:ATP-binding protein [Bacteroidales bacterium]MDZ4205004.1 ATP-binding protein [Bacteroidales bacterium]
MKQRLIQSQLIQSIQPGKAIGLFGARRTGKTMVMQSIYQKLSDKKILLVQGENLDVSEILSSQRVSTLKKFLSGYELLFIDEAQRIPNIGVNLKLIIDTIPDVGIFFTGSAAFDLSQKTGEPLTGRGRNFMLYPFAQAELEEDFLQAKENLESRLIYGYYPQVVLSESNDEKIATLASIRDGYLLKDILELDNLKNSLFILNLLRLLAFQIGNDVSLAELASALHVSRKTVVRYIDLLEKSYVIFPHYGFSRNLRKEFSKSPRFYFWDNGIRNVIIQNFNRLQVRDDVGKLWENFCIAERKKINHYRQRLVNYYFWRTYDQKEIDLIEESTGLLYGFEFKWKPGKTKTQYDFLNAYPGSSLQVITPENYLDFIG